MKRTLMLEVTDLDEGLSFSNNLSHELQEIYNRSTLFQVLSVSCKSPEDMGWSI